MTQVSGDPKVVLTLGFKRLFGTDSWRGMRQLVDGTSTLPASEDPV